MTLDYFTLVEFRELPDVPSPTYSDDQVTAAAEFFQDIVEGECQAAFVGRAQTDVLDGDGGTRLTLSTPHVLSITSVTVDGVALADEFTVDAGVLERRTAGTFTPQPWTRGRRNISVTYETGYSAAPPADIKDAVMWATRDRLISQNSENGHNPRLSSMTNDLGGSTTFVLPGEKRPSGYPELDAVIARWARKLNTVSYP